jgi:zinc protease
MKISNLLLHRTIGILLLGALWLAACSGPQQPQGEKAAGSSAQTTGTGIVPPGIQLATQMPAAAPTKPYTFPKAAMRTLENGVQTFVVSDGEQPMVTVRLVLTGAGSINDPAGKPGVASLTADLLTQGTAARSAQQIAETIDFVGGTLNASADKDGAYLAVSVVKKDFALAMDLLADILLRPAFKKEELERRRQQAVSNLEVQYSDPGYIADVVFQRVVYGSHPYGLPGSGTPDSLQKIGREDLVGFWQAHFGPERALLAFAGDINPDAAFAAADKYLGKAAWPRRASKPAGAAAPEPVRGMRIVCIDKPDANQSQIRIGRLGIPRNHPDYLPLYVANRIFGGGFNSRLSTEVRQKKGLTYGAYSGFNSYLQTGDFSASTFTRTETTIEAAKLMVDLIAKMSSGELGSGELDFARDYLAGVFPIQSETGEQVATKILAVAQYSLPADYYDNYQHKVLAVGPAQIKEMSGRYFDASNLDLILVGNAKAFREALKKEFPKARYEEIPFDKINLLADNLQRQ